MNTFTLLLLFVIFIAIFLVIRSIVRAYRRTLGSPQPRFPMLSICLLSISLLLLVVGTFFSLLMSDAIGTAIATLGGFLGLLESHMRHKREAVQKKNVI